MLKGIIEKIGYDYNIDLVELEIPVDHLHLVVREEPKMSPSDVMQIIKSISARESFRYYPEIKIRSAQPLKEIEKTCESRNQTIVVAYATGEYSY